MTAPDEISKFGKAQMEVPVINYKYIQWTHL